MARERIPGRPRQFSDLRAGQKMLVQVESVFEGGLVVSCGNEGSSFCVRGALLLVPEPPNAQ